MTVGDMANAIKMFYAEYKKPFVVTLDHTLLVRQSASDTSKPVTLQNLATMLTEMKNKLPVTFIILTQLNREIDNAERQKPGKLENYPTEADVFGSDYLLQCADVMIAYNRPAKYNISRYGPQKYIITPSDKYLLAMHVLKNRFGETSIQWYKADYAKMEVVEALEPDKEPYTAKSK
jgi:replicative DNA helicase